MLCRSSGVNHSVAFGVIDVHDDEPAPGSDPILSAAKNRNGSLGRFQNSISATAGHPFDICPRMLLQKILPRPVQALLLSDIGAGAEGIPGKLVKASLPTPWAWVIRMAMSSTVWLV